MKEQNLNQDLQILAESNNSGIGRSPLAFSGKLGVPLQTEPHEGFGSHRVLRSLHRVIQANVHIIPRAVSLIGTLRGTNVRRHGGVLRLR